MPNTQPNTQPNQSNQQKVGNNMRKDEPTAKENRGQDNLSQSSQRQ